MSIITSLSPWDHAIFVEKGKIKNMINKNKENCVKKKNHINI